MAEAAFVLVAMFLLWLLSLKLNDSSIVDVFWGLGFVGIAWISVARGHGSWLSAALVTLWGGRLSLHLYLRNRKKPEDPRYAAMRAKAGAAWPVRSLFVVFGLQGALMWLVSLPLQAPVTDPWASAIVLLGIGIEAVADAQLKRHKRDHPGELCTTGLWSWSRHPNYFGDFVVWWGLFFLVGRATWWAAVSPVAMSVLLMRVSGVTLLEQSMKRRPGWDEYARRTSAFFPRAPRL